MIPVLINVLTTYPPTAVQNERMPIAAPPRKRQKRVGTSHGCSPQDTTGPSPTELDADLPGPPPAGASPPPIVEPPVCGPPLPAPPSHVSPEQHQTPITFSCWALSRKHLNFQLAPPAFFVSSDSVNYIYELAAVLLNKSLDWACTVPAFSSLQEHDRLALLQHSWSDLVLLGAAQCSGAFPQIAFLNLVRLHAHKNRLENLDRGNGGKTLGQAVAIRGFISTDLQELNIDEVEYGYMKAAALFKPGTCRPEVFCISFWST